MSADKAPQNQDKVSGNPPSGGAQTEQAEAGEIKFNRSGRVLSVIDVPRHTKWRLAPSA